MSFGVTSTTASDPASTATPASICENWSGATSNTWPSGGYEASLLTGSIPVTDAPRPPRSSTRSVNERSLLTRDRRPAATTGWGRSRRTLPVLQHWGRNRSRRALLRGCCYIAASHREDAQRRIATRRWPVRHSRASSPTNRRLSSRLVLLGAVGSRRRCPPPVRRPRPARHPGRSRHRLIHRPDGPAHPRVIGRRAHAERRRCGAGRLVLDRDYGRRRPRSTAIYSGSRIP